jgi:hypothetical protein
MSEMSAKKRPPERPRPRGAKDTLLFRERLDRCAAGQWGSWRGQSELPLRLYSKRCVGLHACAESLRGPQECPKGHARMQTRPRGTTMAFLAAGNFPAAS